MKEEMKVLRNPILFNEPTRCPFCKSSLLLIRLTDVEDINTEGEELCGSSFLSCPDCNRTFKDEQFYSGCRVYHGIDYNSLKEKFNEQLRPLIIEPVYVKNPLYDK